MDLFDILRSFAALAFTLGLIAGGVWLLKRSKIPGLFTATAGDQAQRGRLEVLASRSIDARHKLILLRRDSVQHLLLIGPGHTRHIETITDAEISDAGHDKH